MLFPNREEQLIKAFLELGKLSVKEMMELSKGFNENGLSDHL